MKGRIEWRCFRCGDARYNNKVHLRIITSDPGSSYIAFLSRFWPSKKCVKINHVCGKCVDGDEMKEMKQIELGRFEASSKESGKQKAWERQAWEVWLTRVQYEQLKREFSRSGRINLSLGVWVTLRGA